MNHNDQSVPFYSSDGKRIMISRHIASQSPYLSGLIDIYLQHNALDNGIPMPLTTYDLCLSKFIISMGFCPGDYQTSIKPDNFHTCSELCNFLGITNEIDIGQYNRRLIYFIDHFMDEIAPYFYSSEYDSDTDIHAFMVSE